MSGSYITLKNFRACTPATPEQRELAKQNVLFLMDESGADWYESQRHFSPDTMKIGYDGRGIIKVIATGFTDVSSLWPDGLSVSEVEDNEENRRVDNTGNWVYDGEKLFPACIPRRNYRHRQRVRRRVYWLTLRPALPLQDAVELGIASDEEVATLTALKKYRVLVNRVDPAAPVWPEQPE
jgi:hypothetical protein